jgi:hypothetical protein
MPLCAESANSAAVLVELCILCQQQIRHVTLCDKATPSLLLHIVQCELHLFWPFPYLVVFDIASQYHFFTIVRLFIDIYPLSRSVHV